MPESHSLPCGFYITVHVLSSGNCPNCTLYPVVTTTLQEIFKLLSTLLFYCRISEQNIAFFYFYVRFIYLFIFFSFYEKSILKARIGDLNLSEPMKHFLLFPCVTIY